MIPQKHAISDNISLSYINTDKFKSEVLSLCFDMPLTPEKYILSHVLCLYIGRGCERLPSLAHINRELDDLYSATLSFTAPTKGDNLAFCISVDLISNRFVTDGTDVLRGTLCTAADMLLRPLTKDGVFIEETLEKVKTSFIDQIRSIKNHPKSYASARLSEIMGRYLSNTITLEYILKITKEVDVTSLYKFYVELITSTKMRAFYIGSQSVETVSEAMTYAFSAFRGSSSYSPALPQLEKPTEFISVTEDMPLKQGNLALGFRTGAGHIENNSAALTMFNEIFGGTAASKLFLNVRERMSLCYYCSSKISPITGNLTVSSGLDNANRDIAIAEILRQLELIKKGEISEQEMRAARQGIAYNYSQAYDSPGSLLTFYSERELFGISISLDERKKELLSVSAEDICALANGIVHDTQFYIHGTSTESEDEYDE